LLGVYVYNYICIFKIGGTVTLDVANPFYREEDAIDADLST